MCTNSDANDDDHGDDYDDDEDKKTDPKARVSSQFKVGFRERRFLRSKFSNLE